MKKAMFLLLCLCVSGMLTAQAPLSQDEALKQLYSHYDAASKTAQWGCAGESGPPNGWWSCLKEYATVDVAVQLMAQVQEAGVEKLYLIASAKPAHGPDGYDCNACGPAIGVAVFALQEKHWIMESASPAAGFYGAWGNPPMSELIAIGPNKHGVLLTKSEITAQGDSYSSKWLLAPIGKTVAEVWIIGDELDNKKAYYSKDVENIRPSILYRSSAAARFDCIIGECANGYFDIEVISRGTSWRYGEHLKDENWTEVYQFKDGKYELVRHQSFREIKVITSPKH